MFLLFHEVQSIASFFFCEMVPITPSQISKCAPTPSALAIQLITSVQRSRPQLLIQRQKNFLPSKVKWGNPEKATILLTGTDLLQLARASFKGARTSSTWQSSPASVTGWFVASTLTERLGKPGGGKPTGGGGRADDAAEQVALSGPGAKNTSQEKDTIKHTTSV